MKQKTEKVLPSVAAVGATLCSTGTGPYKRNKKRNVGEMLKYLTNRSDRARFWRKEGSVLDIDLEALRQAMEEENTGQW